MPQIPNFEDRWKYENGFYMTSPPQRIAKLLSHWELYKKASGSPGEIVECGVFKGASLIRLATFREIDSIHFGQKIIGFDTFGKFPKTDYEPDKENRRSYIEGAGEKSLSTEQTEKIFDKKGINKNIELVKGDIKKTVPRYIEKNPQLRISILHVDVDIYEPSVTIMENLFPRVVEGGVVIFDDYGDFDGESTAIEEKVDGEYELRSMPCGVRGAYLIK